MNLERWKRAAIRVAALILVGSISWILSGTASRAEETKVRVGYYPVTQYQDANEDGTYAGFGYDYYMQIQKYTRWDYDFVIASYADCLQMLMNGEIDIMSGIMRTETRESMVLFSDVSVSNTQNKLYCRADSDMFYEDYEQFDGCKVALMRGTLHEELDRYCEAHNFDITIVEYDSLTDMEEALMKGEVDMVHATSITVNIDTKIVARLAKIPLYYAVAKDRPEILAQLNDALQKIIDNNPNFYTQMSEKYTLDGANATATFTKGEMDYIQSEQIVYVIMNAYWAPISWYDEESGEYKGIVVDVLEKISEYSGLKFEYMTEPEFDARAAENPDMINHVLAILADDNAWAVGQSVLMSNHIVDASVVMVTRRGAHQSTVTEDSIIALPYRFYISWCMKDQFREDQIVYYNTVEECLDAINEGKADATYVNELVATYFLSELEYSNLFATANSGYNENLAFAVNKDSEAPLLGILDKSLLCIGSNEMDRIIIQNSIAEQKISLRGLYYSEPTLIISVIIGIVIVIAILVIVFYTTVTKRRRMNLELEREQQTATARTEFFMMISHELRTPLNAIVGYLELTENECRDKGIHLDYLKQSQNAAKQLTAISRDMLDYTDIASNTVELHDMTFDLKDAVRDVEQNISPEALKKGIRFQFLATQIQHEFVIGDKLRIVQIMQNILSNAVKFTGEGGEVRAKVSQRVNEEGELELQFVAQDTGVGMSEEFLQKVCTPFNQQDRAYSRTHGGLGLGLYLTKVYLEVMKGKMEVSSTPGEGSIFTITLPLKKAHSTEVLQEKVDFSDLRALVGGTDEEENKQLKDLLKRLGIKSDLVDSEEMVLRRLQSRAGTEYEHKLCILDESLLETGTSLIEQVGEVFQKPLPVFVMTSRTERMEEMLAEYLNCQVLYKPIFQSVLFDAVLNTFGEYTLTDSAEEAPSPNTDAGKATESETAAQTAETVETRPLHALIAEDNHINADILVRVLKRQNVEATVCENGQLALEAFTASEPGTYDIIFMDIQMPVMNGYEATRSIRSAGHAQSETIPIVAVSANAFPEDIANSLKSGMNEHLSKPINGRILSVTLNKFCR